MLFEVMLGLRYTRSRKRARKIRFASVISFVTMLGTALGVAALIVVLSVMNGFQEELRTRILGVASHIQITGFDGPLPAWQSVADDASSVPHVIAAAPYVQEQAMLSFGDANRPTAVRGAMLRGVLPADEEKVADFADYMYVGSLDGLQPGRFGIVLGSDLARALRIEVGEKVTVIAAQGVVTPAAVLPRMKQFEVVGLFEAGMAEYDSALALVHMQDAQTLFRLGDDVTGVRLKLDDLFLAPAVTLELAQTVRTKAYVNDWTRVHANFFRAVQLEKTMMAVIVCLIVAVAAFNIVSTLVMAVQEKLADIAILRTLGASPRSIMAIFVLQGAITGVVGLVAGVIGGIVLANNLDILVKVLETLTGTVLWDKNIYYISDLPSKVLWTDVALISTLSLVLTLLATLYPSLTAARVQPAEALRYE